MTTFTTSKGKLALFFGGFSYRIGYVRLDESKRWRCIKDNCPGTISTDSENGNIAVLHVHNHAPNEDLVLARHTISRLRMRAELETTAMGLIGASRFAHSYFAYSIFAHSNFRVQFRPFQFRPFHFHPLFFQSESFRVSF